MDNWEIKTGFSGEQYYETENESGCFTCDKSFQLLHFYPAKANKVHSGNLSNNNVRAVRQVIIPEGVAQIGSCDGSFDNNHLDSLCDMCVVEEIKLPHSLRIIGTNAFMGCLIMSLKLGDTLRIIGPGALMGCYIHVLRLSENMPLPEYTDYPPTEREGILRIHGRQFKESEINTLIAPKDYPYKILMPEAKVNHIHRI